MSESARVDSIDSLKQFRVALLKFIENANVALGDSDSELHRVQMWLEMEQTSHWQNQIRKRTEAVSRAKEALRMKKVFKDATGARQSYIDEEKALAIAKRLLEEAEQKLIAVKQWVRRFQKEAEAYKGSVQRLATFIEADLTVAAAKLERMTGSLEAYVAYASPAMAASSIPSTSAEPASSTVPAPPTAKVATNEEGLPPGPS